MEPLLSFWQVMLLAFVQGFSEFLPISSDGHLCVLASLMGRDLDIPTLTIVLHLGSLAAIIVFYFHKVWRLMLEDRRVIIHLIIGTIPAVLVAVAFKLIPKAIFKTEKSPLDEIMASPVAAGLFLPVTGALLLWGQAMPPGNKEYRAMPFMNAWWIGCAQALAILPGLSRSGSTIATGLRLGLSRQSAATFSFLLAIPAIMGAGVLELKDLLSGEQQTGPPTADPVHMAIGAFVAFVVGIVSLWILVKILERGRLTWFAYYCIAAGIGVLIWQGFVHFGGA